MAAKGTIFDIKRYAVHDGPGIRTTVFFKGCPLRCSWCHNPEGITPFPEIMVFAGHCLKGCRDCVAVCPRKALGKHGAAVALDRARCDGCGACARACPSEALQVTGRSVSVAEVMEELAKDIPFYRQSGGGATFSGGEPMLQSRFLGELLEQCRKQGIHAAVDTSGCAPFAEYAKVLPLADLVLYDMKLMDDERHRRFTGVSNRLILDNLVRISRSGRPLSVRIPIVPGVNDTDRDLEQTADFCAGLPQRHPVHLLPYHRGYAGKAERLGLAMVPSSGTASERTETAFRADTQPPTPAMMKRAREIFSRRKLTVKIGG